MASSGMLRHVTLVRTDVSDELSASIIRVTRIGEVGTTLAVTNNRRRFLATANVVPSSPILITLMMEALISSETSVHTRATRRNIPEDATLQKHKRSVDISMGQNACRCTGPDDGGANFLRNVGPYKSHTA
jgi:hypothetical protein